MRPAVWLPLALFVLVAAALGIGLTLNPREIPSALIDRPFPEIDLPPLDGEAGGLARADIASGEVVLVNIFASWCAPCRIEHPFLEEMAAQGIVIHGIAYKDAPEATRAMLAELGNPYRRIGVDRDGRAGIELGVYGVPETFVISGDGRIRYKHVGPILPVNQADILRAIEEAGQG